MKKYDVSDFRCFFAQERAKETLQGINLDILKRYYLTDLREKLRDAMMAYAQEINAIPDKLPPEHPHLRLNNGTTVTITDANAFGQSLGFYTYLKAIEQFDIAFSKNTDPVQLAEKLMDMPDASAGEINLQLAMRMYPADATIIFASHKFAADMQNPKVYMGVLSVINLELPELGIQVPGPQMPPLNAMGLLELIQTWHNMSLELEQVVIPNAKKRDDWRPN